MTGPSERLLGHLRRTLGRQVLAGLSDGQLLREFVAGNGSAECAFEVLVRRHGPMVLRTCRAAARDGHDAEDAFQATFLILVRRAGGLTLPDSLGPWLFGVARRVALRARADAARRQARERSAALAMPSPRRHDDETVAVVHDEVGRLPAALRAAVVLCDLEGLTYQEAAERLGWTHDTVRGRLARARERLRQRLARLGVGPNVAVAVAEVPRALVAATTRAAAVVAGQSTGAVPASILALANGGLQTMLMTNFKSAVLTFIAAGVVAAGAIGLSAQDPLFKHGQDEYLLRLGYTIQETKVAAALTADPADRIIELVLQAKQQAQANKTAEAVQSLNKLEELAKEWANQLQPGQARGAARGQRLTAREMPELYRFDYARSASDVESRLRDVEQKLDRILKAFENPPTPRGGGPRGGRGAGGGARRGGGDGGDAGDAGGGARRSGGADAGGGARRGGGDGGGADAGGGARRDGGADGR